MTITRAQTRAALEVEARGLIHRCIRIHGEETDAGRLDAILDAVLVDISTENELLHKALEEIVAAHLGDCPTSMDERDFARAHNHRVRMIARDALRLARAAQ